MIVFYDVLPNVICHNWWRKRNRFFTLVSRLLRIETKTLFFKLKICISYGIQRHNFAIFHYMIIWTEELLEVKSLPWGRKSNEILQGEGNQMKFFRGRKSNEFLPGEGKEGLLWERKEGLLWERKEGLLWEKRLKGC